MLINSIFKLIYLLFKLIHLTFKLIHLTVMLIHLILMLIHLISNLINLIFYLLIYFWSGRIVANATPKRAVASTSGRTLCHRRRTCRSATGCSSRRSTRPRSSKRWRCATGSVWWHRCTDSTRGSWWLRNPVRTSARPFNSHSTQGKSVRN